MAPPQAVPKEVIDLVEHFERDADAFRSPAYNEAQLRHQFLDPFFEALGWDVNNRQRHAEAYKDVIHEDAIKVGGETKAPDYCFRIGGARKFFVEAKKPALNLKDDPAPAFQLRRYAWSSRLPLSVLTDFQELALYDCRIKPLPRDKASAARIRYFTCRDYVEHWDEIAGILSKDAVLQGSFDRFVEAKRLKRGTAQVDDAFLQEIEEWRKDLASNLATRNPRLTQRQVNFAVQRTIDRIIFLRISEDRGIESYGQLRKLADGSGIYRDLCTIFERADEKYNSGLFHFHPEKERAEQPDTLTLKLALDDEKLKRIFKRLYYPDSPYEFSVLPADILGQVYEQFLGKVIRLTEGHHARVEDKPEVKKAGGVYYTPTYIVDYIVRHTVGALLHGDPDPASVVLATPSFERAGIGRSGIGSSGLQARVAERARLAQRPGRTGLSSELSSRASATGAERSDAAREREPRDLGFPSSQATLSGKTPKQAAKLRILDPACGSGSFLIGAYQYLLDWHRDWYVGDGPEKHRKELYQGAGGDWRLTISEKKRILRNNIYGVDIDSQAVEVTKLSLLLKVLEGESEQTLNTTLRLFHERALPDLGSNIKCGNSLIGPDFYSGQQMSLLDDDERLRINAFDWNAEFPETMKGGGFDAVIGNPPYIRIQTLRDTVPLELAYYKKTYHSAATGNYDIYVVFVERGWQLLREEGLLGYILPSKFFVTDYGEGLRQILTQSQALEEIVDFKHEQVFQTSTTYTCLLFLRRGESEFFRYSIAVPPTALALQQVESRTLSIKEHDSRPWSFLPKIAAALLARLNDDTRPLLDLAEGISRGSSTGADQVFVLTHTARGLRTRSGEFVQLEPDLLRIPLYATDFGRYRSLPAADDRIIFPYRKTAEGYLLIPEKTLREEYPKTHRYLSSCREELDNRQQFSRWYGYSAPRNLEQHDSAQLLVPLLADRASFAETPSPMNRYCLMASGGSSISLAPTLSVATRYILGLLNSALLFWVLKNISNLFRGGWITCTKQYVGRLPIRLTRNNSPTQKAAHDRIAGLATEALDLGKKLAAQTDHERTALQRQIEVTEHHIDQLVYQLYGLTEEEIALVESATAPSPSSRGRQ